jgi:hypothetical protein
MASYAAEPNSKRSDVLPNLLESAARASIEQHAGRILIDEEWLTARARFLEFVGVLRGWDRKTTAPRRGNVEVLCQRER